MLNKKSFQFLLRPDSSTRSPDIPQCWSSSASTSRYRLGRLVLNFTTSLVNYALRLQFCRVAAPTSLASTWLRLREETYWSGLGEMTRTEDLCNSCHCCLDIDLILNQQEKLFKTNRESLTLIGLFEQTNANCFQTPSILEEYQGHLYYFQTVKTTSSWSQTNDKVDVN